MKKFSFSLQRMLGFKEMLYEKERNYLAQLRAERLVVANRREGTERQMLADDVAFRRKAAEDGVKLADVTAQNYKRRGAMVLCEMLDEELVQMDEVIEQQLEIVIALDKEVKSLEKLREKQWEEYLADAAREESERILELVSGRYVEDMAEARRAEAMEEASVQRAAAN